MRIKEIATPSDCFHEDFQKVRCYNKVVGFFPHLFGKVYSVKNAKGETFYLNKKSYVSRLFQTTNGIASQKFLKKNKKIHQRAIEVLNPIVGKKIRLEVVSNLFHQFRTQEHLENLSQANSKKEYLSLIDTYIDEIKIKNRHLPLVEYDAEELENILEPGDVILRKIPDDMHNSVVEGQKFQRYLLTGRRDREAYKFSHVAMYIGEGRIAEAAWPSGKQDEIRSLRLDDPRFALPKKDGRQYWVMKPVNRTLGEKAAAKAKEIVQELPLELDGDQDLDKQKTLFRYTICEAARSLYHTSWFGPFGKMRYIQQYLDDKNGDLPKTFQRVENFFCSYLIAYCYQVAEAREILPQILKPEYRPSFLKTSFGKAIYRQVWSRFYRWCHIRDLNREVKMRYDAKRTSPQDFRNFMLMHPKLFDEGFVIRSQP